MEELCRHNPVWSWVSSVVAGPVQEGGQETGLTLTLPSHTLHTRTLQTDTGMWGSGDNADPHRYIVSKLYLVLTMVTMQTPAWPVLGSSGQLEPGESICSRVTS